MKTLVKGIARQFGELCELVLLDLTQYEEYGSGLIVLIENSHLTGRKVGDSGTNIGLEVIRGASGEGDKFSYLAKGKDGRILKCSTMFLRNKKGVPVGYVCINFDITNFMMSEATIRKFINTDELKTDVNVVFCE